jgi:hypothetical protein
MEQSRPIVSETAGALAQAGELIGRCEMSHTAVMRGDPERNGIYRSHGHISFIELAKASFKSSDIVIQSRNTGIE